MRLWLDNTGLQSAGVCLEGSAESFDDVRGLLQLATFLVYSNRVLINGFEEDTIAERTKEFRQHFVRLGVPPDFINIRNEINRKLYAKACDGAATIAAERLEYEFNPREGELIGGDPPYLPQGILERQIRFADLSSPSTDSHKLEDVRKHALDDKAVGACEYMIASNKDLRRAVYEYRQSLGEWIDVYSYQLNVYLRYQLNNALAKDANTIYAPAVGRSEILHDRSEFVLRTLNQELDSVAEEKRGAPVGIPSVFSYLLEKSRGDPTGVINEALKLRDLTSNLRNTLQTYAEEYDAKSAKKKDKIERKIKEMGRALRESVGLSKKVSLKDAIDVHVVLGVPAPYLSVAKFFEWANRAIMYKNLSVLSDIVTSLTYYDDGKKDLRKLFRASVKR